MLGKQVRDLRLCLPAISLLVAGWLFSWLSIWQFLCSLLIIFINVVFLLIIIGIKIRNPRHVKAGTDYLLVALLILGSIFLLQIMILLQIKINSVDPLVKQVASGQIQVQVRGYVTGCPQAYGKARTPAKQANTKPDGGQSNGVGVSNLAYPSSKKVRYQQQLNLSKNCRRGGLIMDVSSFYGGNKSWQVSKQQLKIRDLCIEGIRKGQFIELPVKVLVSKNDSRNIVTGAITDRQIQVADLQQGMNAITRGKAKILADVTGIDAINQNLADRFKKLSVGKTSKQLLPALLLGDRSQLDPDLIASLKASGIMHIVCLSGMHLNIIVAIIKIITGRWDKKLQIMIQILAVLGFLWLVGYSPSLLRAALMAIIVFNAKIFGGGQSLHSLFLVVIVMVMINPTNAYNLGFLYSVLATFGILLGGHKIAELSLQISQKISVFKTGKLTRIGRAVSSKIIEIIGISLLANLAVLPLSSYFQGSINLLAPLANLLVLPLLPIVIVAGAVLIVIPPGFPILDRELAVILELLCLFIFKVSKYLGGIESMQVNFL